MSVNTKKILLIANILLLLAICFLAVKMVNGRASELALERMVGVCKHIVTNVETEEMSLAEAQKYVMSETSHNDYTPEINIFESAEGLLLETDDPIIVNNLLKRGSSKTVRLNCTKIAKS